MAALSSAAWAWRPQPAEADIPMSTWTQMFSAMLIFDGPAFPGPLEQISPWLDMCNRPLDDVPAELAAQTHRRFIKTHTPLDGLEVREDVTYVVTGHDPHDVAVSFDHHAENMDYEHFVECAPRRSATTISTSLRTAAPVVRATGRLVPLVRAR